MAAAAVVLLAGVTLAAGGAFATWAWLHALRRRHSQRTWDDLVARHQELDRELNRIWRHR